MMTDQIRKTVPLTERDLEDIAELLGTDTGREALSVLGVPTSASEGQLLHALLLAGLRSAQHEQEALSYAAQAADPQYQADVAQYRAARIRRASSHPEAG